MRPLAIVLVIVAVLAAGLTALLAKRWTDKQSTARPTVAADSVEVLVLARDVATGSALSDADLRYENWPAVNAGRFMTRKDGDDPKARAIGSVARRPLSEGEPFTPSATFTRDGSGILAGMLAPGMRAVSVAISNASAVSGFVVPGDRVDVVLAADFQRADSEAAGKGGGAIVRYAAETVLADVKVLAVDQQFSKGKDGPTIQGKTATLEVSPDQAEILVTAGLMGQLSLILRGVGPQDAGTQAKRPFTADTQASAAMRALAGGSAKPAAKSTGSSIIINRGGAVGGTP
ncbi:putative flp pilus assembly CpaB [Magnetospirillum gryphiswaldense MSR-1 v2]|uniref:Flp pilus assembly CpaB n=1 Tax=Magnetospirillum gryphiswaldense (strain DSM 6361 / JCM 21280 / NBRC 15271 / MSR-1) TaxID=431944 RepID=V6F008_MAGGM|nr:Flp pilus assembly protein CpaB [Magnetospirillum gryphiswaldense]CDK98825.1 putative flp pilus assembly CpaB [Magnetospirillum gryphiswaldense MSR-1 v2]